MAVGTDQFRRAGRRGRTHVGDEIGEREIGFVSHAADDRNRAGFDGAHDRFFVKRPQVFNAAAAATDNQHIAFGALRCGFNCLGNLKFAARALNGGRINDDGNFGRAAFQGGNDIA